MTALRTIGRVVLFWPVQVTIAYMRWVSIFWPTVLDKFQERLDKDVQDKTERVLRRNSLTQIEMSFYTPNALCRYRVSTFETKEPETLQWIEDCGGGVFYDVGANVGIFSVFYAKLFGSPVYAFEPSSFNLKVLVKNIALNGVSDLVTVIPTPLSDDFGISNLTFSMLDEGGSMTHFEDHLDSDQGERESRLYYRTWGAPLAAMVKAPFNLPEPALIKVDVDGLEDLVLLGAAEVLSLPSLKSVLVEVDERYPDSKNRVEDLLRSSGLKFMHKQRSTMFEDTVFRHSFNQVWRR